MKRSILCLILALCLITLSLAACGKTADDTSDSSAADSASDAGKSETGKAESTQMPTEDIPSAETYVDGGHTLYVRDTNGADSMTAAFKSTDSSAACRVEMEKIDSGDGWTEFSCSADTAVYDRVILSGDSSATQLAFNDYVSGWELNAYHYMPYTHGAESAEPAYERKQFQYDDRTKDILVWTPADYDKNADEKYAVIYMTDAQNLFKYDSTATGSWGVAESALAMAANGGQKCIIVGVENADGWRDDELTPNIGEVLEAGYEDGHGAVFSDFVVDVVMPYINENYNVYADREHTHICGSSSGGIENFYIAMEHPDKFASVGALSPAFSLFSDETWVEYLGKKDFSENAPFVYLYCGNGASDTLEQALYTGTVSMPDNLQQIGYPADKVTVKLSENAIHNEMFWRAVFPDYLRYAFPQSE